MNTSRYYQYIFPGTIAFSIVLMLIGLSMGHPEQLLSGLWKIVTMQDLLITDYIHIAGPAAAFVNAGLVTIISILIIKLAKDFGNKGMIWPLFYAGAFFLVFNGSVTLALSRTEKKLDYFRV